MFKIYRGLKITALAAAIPREVREMAALNQRFAELDTARLIKSTGVERSRVSAPDQTASDLCFAAAEELFAKLSISRESVDALVFVSPHPDFMAPPTSHLLQSRLGLSTSTPCFDMPLGCSGYIYGLLQAALLISSQTAKRVLVLSGETATKILAPNDNSTWPLFGDAGSATLVEYDPDAPEMPLCVFADGANAEAIIQYNSGMRRSAHPSSCLSMKGGDVFTFATREVPRMVENFLQSVSLTTEQIDWFVFHQANKMIVSFIEKKLKLDGQKTIWSIRDYGNTGATSIPLSMVVDSRLAAGRRQKVLLTGFGMGLSWGCALVDLSSTAFISLIEV